MYQIKRICFKKNTQIFVGMPIYCMPSSYILSCQPQAAFPEESRNYHLFVLIDNYPMMKPFSHNFGLSHEL